MKTRTALIVLAMAAATPAYAADMVEVLAEETGLSERQVQMIVGNRTPFIEHRYNYVRSLKQFKRALGEELAQQLIAGETVVLERRREARIATLDERRNEDRMP